MNIIPPIYNASLISYPHPPAQNVNALHLSKQTNSKSASTSGTSKDDDERKHIRELSKRLPGLTNIFNLHHKIGEGSFSSVFLASLKYHDHLPRDQRKLFAIKHLIPTSHPSRIEQELRCLKYIGGCDNVVGLDFCMRKYDTVIFVMPYLPHNKFSEYVLKMDVQETKLYVRNLLLALQRVHQFNIIHRDVKPSNFLYDRVNKGFLLVDFGLAQKMDNLSTSSVAKNQIVTSNTNPSSIDISQTSCSLPLDSKFLNSNNSTNSNTIVVNQLQHSSANTKKRKFDDMNDGQEIVNELEPNLKRQPLLNQSTLQSNCLADCTPLKPLQDDHPKITPATMDVPTPSVLQINTPKLSTVKRQVFVDDNENNKLNKAAETCSLATSTNLHCTNTANIKRLPDNVYLNNYNNLPIDPIQRHATNNIATFTSYYPYPYNFNSNYSSNNFRHHLNLHDVSQYYSNYFSQNSGNMLINNMLLANNPKNYQHYKAQIDYEMYKNHFIQNSFNNYNNLYAINNKSSSKLGVLSNQAQNGGNAMYKCSNKSTFPNGNKTANNVQQQSDRGDVSKQVSVKHEALKKEGSVKSGSTVKLCGCSGKAAVCSICLGRGAYNAPRAGTQGFRPPEVLLKYTEQTTAVDLWACGVILLSIVSGCYPFFRAPDDLTALAEMVTLFGTKPIKDVATILGRHLMCSHMKNPLDLRKLCSHLRYRALKTNSAGSSDLVKSTIDYMQDVGYNDKTDSCSNQCQTLINHSKPLYNANDKSALLFKNSRFMNANSKVVNRSGRRVKRNCEGCSLPADLCVCASEETLKNNLVDKASRYWCGFPDEAFDLLERLLDLNPHTRITATEALRHPFLAHF